VAKFYTDTGDLQGAYLRSQDAVKTAPDDPDAHFALATAALRLKKPDEAIAEYNACLKLDPTDKEAKEARKALSSLKQPVSIRRRRTRAIFAGAGLSAGLSGGVWPGTMDGDGWSSSRSRSSSTRRYWRMVRRGSSERASFAQVIAPGVWAGAAPCVCLAGDGGDGAVGLAPVKV